MAENNALNLVLNTDYLTIQDEKALQAKNEFILDKIETENPVLKGARFYTFIE